MSRPTDPLAPRARGSSPPSTRPQATSIREVDTLADAVAHFSGLGYGGDFRAEATGLREVSTGAIFPAEQLQIDDLWRFEGESDPGDEVLAMALREPGSGVRGTYVVAFGPQMHRLDAEAVRRLRDARPTRSRADTPCRD